VSESVPYCRVVVTIEPLDGSDGARMTFYKARDVRTEVDYPDPEPSPWLSPPMLPVGPPRLGVSLTPIAGSDGVAYTHETIKPRGDEQTESVGSRLDAVLAELSSLVTAEYASPEPRERVVQRIASAASEIAACRQESEVWEIAPDRLAAIRDAIRAGKEGR
jgi:hypothetical protein